MIKKLPIISPCASYVDILKTLFRLPGRQALTHFVESFTCSLRSKHVFLTNSGIVSFYLILEALKKISGRSQVILPAYTAGSLIVAIRKALLKPVLCDISLEDFNLDDNSLMNIVSADTLAVVGVHGFGINMKQVATLRSKIPKSVFLIEDCAQSMGSQSQGRQCGTFGDVGFFSFSRGKNFPLSGGGCIVTNDDLIARALKQELAKLEKVGISSWLGDFLKISAFTLAGNRIIYGLSFPLIWRFKELLPPRDFILKEMNTFQAALGIEMAKRKEAIFSARHINGRALIAGLKEFNKILLPEIPQFSRYVFNRLPVIFKDSGFRMRAQERLFACGIETSRMYLQPLHYMFNLGYASDDFPKAKYLAENLLTLPTHPSVSRTDIDKMIDAIKQAQP